MTLVEQELDDDWLDELTEAFLDVMNRLQALSRAPAGMLSSARFGVLQAVECRGTPPMNTVARAVGVTPRTLTDLVDGLESAGLLRRIPNLADRREVLLELTGAGKAQVVASRMARTALTGEMFRMLTQPERRTLVHLLGKLILIPEENLSGRQSTGPRA
jgi:DNA-binding MarR family transcriptional regulator